MQIDPVLHCGSIIYANNCMQDSEVVVVLCGFSKKTRGWYGKSKDLDAQEHILNVRKEPMTEDVCLYVNSQSE